MQTTLRHAGLADLPAMIAAAVNYRSTGWPTPKHEKRKVSVLREEAEEAIQQVLDAIQGRMTRFDIAEATGMSHNTVNKRLLILMEREKVKRTNRMPYLYFKAMP